MTTALSFEEMDDGGRVIRSLPITGRYVLRINWGLMARISTDKLARLKAAFTEDAMTSGQAAEAPVFKSK